MLTSSQEITLERLQVGSTKETISIFLTGLNKSLKNRLVNMAAQCCVNNTMRSVDKFDISKLVGPPTKKKTCLKSLEVETPLSPQPPHASVQKTSQLRRSRCEISKTTTARLCGKSGQLDSTRLLEGSLGVKFPAIWTDEKQRREA